MYAKGLNSGLFKAWQKRRKMKTKVSKILSLLLITAIMALSLTACFGGVDKDGFCTVVLADGDKTEEYSVDLTKVTGDNGLYSVLEAMQAEGMPLVFDSYGMLASVGSLNPDSSAHEYIRIYTSVESDFDVSDWFAETEYKGVRLGTSGFGASDMQVVDGGIYYLAIETW